MTFNPFPWYRPEEARQARRVESLQSTGFGDRWTPPSRLGIGGRFALLAGAIVPLAILVVLLTGLPPIVQILLGLGAAVAVVTTIRRSRAARRRAEERARRRQEEGRLPSAP